MPSTESAELMPAILVVEDDRGVARALSRALSRGGYRVAECHSAKAASGLSAERFEAAIIDLHLPDGCGLALASALLEAGRIGSVVYFSGSTDRAEIAAAGRSGRFVSKARGADAVLSALREVVPGRGRGSTPTGDRRRRALRRR